MAETLEYKVTLDGVKESNREIKTFGDAFKDVAIQAGKVTVALLAVSKGFNLITQTAQAFFTQQKAENRVEQALLTTGNAANLTAEELKKAATELQRLSNFGDEQILAEVTNSLLTFKNVTGDTFLRAQKVIADMAVVFGGLQTSAMSVGFALNNVSEGITRLRRNGVQFSDSQIKTIKNLEATNRLAEAQAIVLSELESQFGGLAEATADPIMQMKNAWGDLTESIGKSFAPIFYNFKGFVNLITENEQVANILAKSIKVGLAIALAIATKAVIGLIVKMKTLITTMTIAKALTGDWVSILLSVGTGIASVALMTKDWTGSQESLNKSLNTTAGTLEDVNATMNELMKIDISSVISSEQFESINKAVSTFNSNYGTTIDLYNSDISLTDQLIEAKNEAVLAVERQRLGELELHLQKMKWANDEKGIWDAEIKATEDKIKAVQDSIIANQKLATSRKESQTKDILALTKYYELVKFSDSNYFAFKQALNIKEADEYQKTLVAKGYSEVEAGEERRKYLKALNEKIIADAQAVSDSYTPAMMPTAEEPTKWDTSWMSDMIDKRKQLTAQYYEVVKWQDDNYYDYRLANIEEWAESLKEFGNTEIDIEKAKNIKIEELNREKADADRANLENSLTVMKALYNEFFNAVQGMQFDFLHGWESFTKSVEQSFKSMINNMLSHLVTSGLLTLLSSLFGGGFIGVGLFGSVFGGLFKDAPMTPSMVGGGISSTPIITNNSNTYSSNTDINPIVNKLNEVVSAVERIKFSIGRVELAREVEAGNIMRGVL